MIEVHKANMALCVGENRIRSYDFDQIRSIKVHIGRYWRITVVKVFNLSLGRSKPYLTKS